MLIFCTTFFAFHALMHYFFFAFHALTMSNRNLINYVFQGKGQKSHLIHFGDTINS